MTRKWPHVPNVRARTRRDFQKRFEKSSTKFLTLLRAGHSFSEAAEGAGVTAWTVRRWLARGHPTRARLGVDDVFVTFRMEWLAWRIKTIL